MWAGWAARARPPIARSIRLSARDRIRALRWRGRRLDRELPQLGDARFVQPVEQRSNLAELVGFGLAPGTAGDMGSDGPLLVRGQQTEHEHAELVLAMLVAVWHHFGPSCASGPTADARPGPY